MTKYLEKEPFSGKAGGKEYGEGWDRIFGKKSEPTPTPCGKTIDGSRCMEPRMHCGPCIPCRHDGEILTCSPPKCGQCKMRLVTGWDT